MRLLIVFFGIVCLLVARFSGENWRTPAALYTTIWVAFCILPSCFLWTDADWYYSGLLWIEISCLFFSVGQAFGSADKWKVSVRELKTEYYGVKRFSLNIELCRTILIVMFVICVIHIVRSLVTRGFSLSVFYNLESLIDVNNSSAYARYHGDNSATILNQLFLIVEYCLPLVGGFALSFYKKKPEKILCGLSVLPVFVSFFLSNAKAGFIASMIGFVVTYMIGSYIANGKEKRFSPKFIRNAIILAVAFFAVLFISMCLRVGDFSPSTIDYVRKRFMVYMFGQMKAFDEWFTVGRRGYEMTFGTMTYNWFFNLTGLVERHQGVYGYAQTIRTNVFTMFRGIITDFGIVGGIIYCLLRGVVAGYILKIIHRQANVNVLLITLLSATYLFFMYGFIISPWTYTTYFASYFLFFVILSVCRSKGELWNEVI